MNRTVISRRYAGVPAGRETDDIKTPLNAKKWLEKVVSVVFLGIFIWLRPPPWASRECWLDSLTLAVIAISQSQRSDPIPDE
ncbi:hypothetical protein [Rhodoferax antarcticus]|uniref:hypothetical protein n=1 Tax=Rhodoferax antarcticus TaxID=81479 RepID=UPI002224E3FD|nr:hypothetical protein [Rhodoferax antarcticus]MCW2312653.1 hypothetical protein [Rhodoferax antarcticus]